MKLMFNVVQSARTKINYIVLTRKTPINKSRRQNFQVNHAKT